MNAIVLNASIVPHLKCEDHTSFEGTASMPGVKKNNNDEQDLTDRLILSLVFDVTTLAEDIEQVKVCIYGLARQRGLVADK